MTSIKLTLTMPPSINTAYTNARGKGRVKSKELKKWEEENEYVNLEEKYRIIGDEWLEVIYTFYFPLYNKGNKDKKEKDTFNFEKVLSDFLSDKKRKGKIIPGKIPGFKDHLIKKGIVYKMDSDRNEVDIEIKEILGT